jgi:acyl-CoA thioesterase FadM
MAYEVSANGTVAVTGESVQVVIDAETGEKTDVPDEWREHFEAYRDDGP